MVSWSQHGYICICESECVCVVLVLVVVGTFCPPQVRFNYFPSEFTIALSSDNSEWTDVKQRTRKSTMRRRTLPAMLS